MIDKQLLGDLLNSPLTLLVIRDSKIINEVNNLLPYSVGFEIECSKSECYNETNFSSIPNIISIQNDDFEQRYRIPNGIAGIICLFHISRQLKYNSLLNMDSGIHYHIDFTDVKEALKNQTFVNSNKEWVLKELDTWKSVKNVDADRNIRVDMRCWVRIQTGLCTYEFRIGEMTFEYPLLLKRILHLNEISKKLKEEYYKAGLINKIPEPIFQSIDNYQILEYEKLVGQQITPLQREMLKINEKLAKLNKEVNPLEDINPQLRKRLHKLYDDEESNN